MNLCGAAQLLLVLCNDGALNGFHILIVLVAQHGDCGIVASGIGCGIDHGGQQGEQQEQLKRGKRNLQY